MILQWTRGTNACHVGRTEYFNVQLWRHHNGAWVFRVRPDIFEALDYVTLVDARGLGTAKAEVERRIVERLRELSAAFMENAACAK